MKVFVPKELDPAETRVPLLPEDGGKLVKLGATVEVETGLGESISIADEAYRKAGVQIAGDRAAALSAADLILRMSVPEPEDIQLLRQGSIHVSQLDPFNLRHVKRLRLQQRLQSRFKFKREQAQGHIGLAAGKDLP